MTKHQKATGIYSARSLLFVTSFSPFLKSLRCFIKRACARKWLIAGACDVKEGSDGEGVGSGGREIKTRAAAAAAAAPCVWQCLHPSAAIKRHHLSTSAPAWSLRCALRSPERKNLTFTHTNNDSCSSGSIAISKQKSSSSTFDSAHNHKRVNQAMTQVQACKGIPSNRRFNSLSRARCRIASRWKCWFL